jgi:hypothetical protein
MLAHENVDGPQAWDKPGLSSCLVCLVHLVSLIQPNKPDRPNRPNEQDRLTDFFSILLARIVHEGSSRKRADAKRDGHSETGNPEAYSCSMSKG